MRGIVGLLGGIKGLMAANGDSWSLLEVTGSCWELLGESSSSLDCGGAGPCRKTNNHSHTHTFTLSNYNCQLASVIYLDGGRKLSAWTEPTQEALCLGIKPATICKMWEENKVEVERFLSTERKRSIL